MADINDMFEAFPDYDVFTDSTTPPPRPEPRRPFPKQPARHRPLPNRLDRSNDYGDGFGEYVERRTKLSNFTTLFFFPFIILWLEVVLRLSAGESFLSRGVVYTLLFSIPTSCIFTLLCTFASEKFNRIFANIIAAALTLLYLWQLVNLNAAGTLFAFSGNTLTPDFKRICSTTADKWFFLLLSVVPLLVSLLVGKRMFRFKRIRIQAKIVLIIIAVVFHLIAFGFVYTSQFVGSDSYTLYRSTTQSTSAQERFGLITMQRIDILEMIL